MTNVADLNEDPEWDEMRALGRVCAEIVRAIRMRPATPHLEDLLDLTAEERHLVGAALVIVRELRKGGALELPDVGPFVVRPSVGEHGNA